MRHKWDYTQFGRQPRDMMLHGRRVCSVCGLEQTKHDRQNWGRVVGYEWSGDGRGECLGGKLEPVNLRPLSKKAHRVWLSSGREFMFSFWDHVQRWYIYEASLHPEDDGFYEEPSFGQGFDTLGEAVDYAGFQLAKERAKQPKGGKRNGV